MNARKKNLQEIGQLYEFSYIDSRLKCVYCDFQRECVDHVPPVSLAANIGTKEIFKSGISLQTVPCCRSCNSLLGAKKLFNYEERLSHLYEAYNQKLQSSTLWGDDEIEELSGNLKRMICAKQKHLRNEIVARIRSIEINLLDAEGRSAALDRCTKKLAQRHSDGEVLSPIQIQMYKSALEDE